ncbi:MAG: PfkB family carbohydrate kinase, partial [Lachnospiraceae bacterium]|nr:PfkB family carbohydrate kinase [Lachnospiraceae bacterium]
DTTNLMMDEDARTTLAFVQTFADGDRDFSFYRNPGADMMLRADELDTELLKATKIFHFGTLSMTHEGVREATKKAIQIAKESGALISFDPNLREPLWKSLDDAKEQAIYGIKQCDILKISDNEIQWLTGEMDFTEGVKKIRQISNIPLILVSMGRDGSRAYYGDSYVEIAPFLQENTIETTGAGDTFGGCVLHYVLEHGIENLSQEQLKDMITYANAAASIITTRKGALRVMPSGEEVETLIKSR